MTETKGAVPTLSPLLKFFVGLELSVELKNGRKFHGMLDSSDNLMNLVLTRAARGYPPTNSHPPVHQTLDTPLEYNMLHIRGASIRYIIFPKRVDLPKLIKLGMDREREAKDRYARGKRPAK
jgi:small nuclear ribonucleoprotein (snRNP)-like protein